MLDPDFLDTLPAEAVELYQEFADGVIADLARRIGNLSYTSAGWSAQRLQEAGLAYQDIIKRVAQLTGKSEAAIRGIFYRAGVRSMRFDEKIYKAAGVDLPLTLSPAMQDVLNIGILKTNGILRNLTLTTALSGQQEFIRASDIAYLEVTSGTRDYNSAIKKAVTSLADNNMEFISYAGHRDHLDVAVRRTVLTGAQKTAGDMQIQRMDEMGTNLVEVSAHAGARNEGTGPRNHESWQGKVYSRIGEQGKYKDFVTETGYGTGLGLKGYSCRHSFYAFFEGVSTRVYNQEMREQLANKTVTLNGVEMSQYDASQVQRGLERKIRFWKRRKIASDATGLGIDTSVETSKIRYYQSQLREFVRQTKLPRQNVREQVVGQ